MKTTYWSALAGSLILAATLVSAPAQARQKCESGTFWSKAKGACVVAGTQAKPQAQCMRFSVEGGVGPTACAS